MADSEVQMSSHELEPARKQDDASLLENPYLLGVALVSKNPIFKQCTKDQQNKIVCISRRILVRI
jgi:hypothetical protein